MPELPEVEIVKQSLIKGVQFKKITDVIIKNRNLRFKIEKNLKNKILNKNINSIYRKSKYLILKFDKNEFLIIHFGMSGTLHKIKDNFKLKTNLSFYHSKNLPKKHNHIYFIFKNFKIIYNDPRRFGFIKYFNSHQKLNNFFKNYGPDPFEKSFNIKYLKKKLKDKKKNIKNLLLDQKFISGIGNIYANEILFYSKINPFKKGENISNYEINKILKISKSVLNKAIKKGGSSIRDFKNSKGKKGSYQEEFAVYGREKKNCKSRNCNFKIIKINISNRSTYICNNCQKK
tara:strand:- start:1222 stop:2085 length:864 start_codon:yes stop_codon:yes gene_type:complete